MRQDVFNENSEESIERRRCQFNLENLIKKFILKCEFNHQEYLGGCFLFERNWKIFEKIIDNGY
ncbi:hypothetical protein GCM10011539_09770 [Finegoldia magna]